MKEYTFNRCQTTQGNQYPRLGLSDADRSPCEGLGQRTLAKKPPPFLANMASTRSRSPGEASPPKLNRSRLKREPKPKPKPHHKHPSQAKPHLTQPKPSPNALGIFLVKPQAHMHTPMHAQANEPNLVPRKPHRTIIALRADE